MAQRGDGGWLLSWLWWMVVGAAIGFGIVALLTMRGEARRESPCRSPARIGGACVLVPLSPRLAAWGAVETRTGLMGSIRNHGSNRVHGAAQGTRDALTAAAADVLAERGYVGATARVIAARADCNQALVFYHFGSVDGLLIAALAAVSTRRMASFGTLLEEAATPAALLDLLHLVISEDVRNGDLAILVALLDASRANPVLADAVSEHLQPWQDLTERTVRRLLAAHPLGSLLPVPAPVLARLVMATVLGLELLDTPEGRGLSSLREMTAPLWALAGTATDHPSAEAGES